VLEDYRNGNQNIYLQDLSTKKQTRISTGNAYQRNSAIYGNRIVWEDYRSGNPVVGNENGNPDIYMNDLSTKKETRITTNGSRQSYPAIYNRIVWDDDRNGEIDIYMYDLSTKNESRITTNSPEACFPAIYGNRIVWMNIPNGVWHVYIYDLSTHQEVHTTGTSDQWEPAIYGDRIVWSDNRNEYVDSSNQWHNSDIYMDILSYLPVTAFSAYPLSGKAPLTVRFTDKSTGSPASWSWNFGDKSISTARSPVHKYAKAGKYTVKLTVKNAAGSNTATKSGYIIASK
jgi:beta propeller repeat protein